VTGRWRAVAIGIATIAAAAVLATLVVGVEPWWDYVNLMTRVSAPVTTPHNYTPGAIVYLAGASVETASLVQTIATVLVGVWVVIVSRYSDNVVSYLVAVVASQAVSPLLWDHYALVLLIPVAWMLDRGHWWAVAIPLALSLPIVILVPAPIFTLAFLGTMVLVPLVDWSDQSKARRLSGLGTA
jgi:hypothetical protein